MTLLRAAHGDQRAKTLTAIRGREAGEDLE
jgi:hypothetical protein